MMNTVFILLKSAIFEVLSDVFDVSQASLNVQCTLLDSYLLYTLTNKLDHYIYYYNIISKACMRFAQVAELQLVLESSGRLNH